MGNNASMTQGGTLLRRWATALGIAAMLSVPVGTVRAAAEVESGQRAHVLARERLVQVRTLLAAQDSQSSVGSGFLVSNEGHLITNYHVVSQFALRPGNFRLVYATADGRQGALQLLDVDVINDLALLKPVVAAEFAGRGVMEFRDPGQPLVRGERIQAMGNPLDVGFAVVPGVYNGLVERSFRPTIFFGGSLSAGMSGGPAIDEQGRVIGINVASRRDGEQVSFLVPAGFAMALLERGRNKPAVKAPLHAAITAQLQVHQEELVKQFVELPWRDPGHPRYRIPMPAERFLRCWGGSSAAGSRGLLFERSDCVMDSRVFVSGGLTSGHLAVRHETYDGRKLGALRFAQRHSQSFGNEAFGRPSRAMTPVQCDERFVDRDGLPLRALICLRGYKKFVALYDLTVLVATVDGQDVGAQGRLDAHGVSFENAQRLAQHYLNAFGPTPESKKTAQR